MAAGRLGVPSRIARLGGQYNNINAYRTGSDYTSAYDFGPGTYSGNASFLDDHADQQAIHNGNNYSAGMNSTILTSNAAFHSWDQ